MTITLSSQATSPPGLFAPNKYFSSLATHFQFAPNELPVYPEHNTVNTCSPPSCPNAVHFQPHRVTLPMNFFLI